MVRQSGAPFWAHLQASLAKNYFGDPLCRMVISDINERKTLEEKTARSDALLRQSQALRMDAVGRLAAGMAHKMNNPLTAILGYAEGAVTQMVSGDPLDIPMRTIVKEALRCKDLVKRLLKFSRAQAPKRGSLDSIVDSVLALITAQARLRNIEVVRQFPEAPLPVLVDELELQQVLVNLCNNAIDAMPEGGRLTVALVQTLPRSGGPAFAEIQVTDTGMGIPAKNLERIFEPFFTTKEVGEGRGLGLSIIYEIVQRYGGEISFESVVGKGTTFRVHLPLIPKTL